MRSSDWRSDVCSSDLPVGSIAPGSELTFATGDNGNNATAAWGGCIMERQTTAFGPTETAPSTAYDMDIESPPTSDDATKWKLFLPAFAYDRGGTSPETSSTDRKKDRKSTRLNSSHQYAYR